MSDLTQTPVCFGPGNALVGMLTTASGRAAST
jgi:hypothetical protein